ncbi:hypothetical protein PFISCL1PPCAC_8791, partial [Pristionchus fissidentatus]
SLLDGAEIAEEVAAVHHQWRHVGFLLNFILVVAEFEKAAALGLSEGTTIAVAVPLSTQISDRSPRQRAEPGTGAVSVVRSAAGTAGAVVGDGVRHHSRANC